MASIGSKYTYFLDYGSSYDLANGYDTGNVVAVLDYDNSPDPATVVVALFDIRDSAVATNGLPLEYLERCTIQVSEQTARLIHPRLFEYIDNGKQ